MSVSRSAIKRMKNKINSAILINIFSTLYFTCGLVTANGYIRERTIVYD